MAQCHEARVERERKGARTMMRKGEGKLEPGLELSMSWSSVPNIIVTARSPMTTERERNKGRRDEIVRVMQAGLLYCTSSEVGMGVVCLD